MVSCTTTNKFVITLTILLTITSILAVPLMPGANPSLQEEDCKKDARDNKSICFGAIAELKKVHRTDIENHRIVIKNHRCNEKYAAALSNCNRLSH